jgi:hypothetical protein
MNDNLITHHGELVAGHVGPFHVERTPSGVQVTLVGAVNPTATISPAEARRLGMVLATAHD